MFPVKQLRCEGFRLEVSISHVKRTKEHCSCSPRQELYVSDGSCGNSEVKATAASSFLSPLPPQLILAAHLYIRMYGNESESGECQSANI